MKILHVICSPRGQASESQKLSRKIIGFLLQRDPTAIVIDRVIGGGALLHIDDSYATALGATRRILRRKVSERIHVAIRRAHSRAREFGLCGHRNANA